ncbi:hypothetical protein C8R43DRAFT_298081 [Mycena crocata]|nr:hypothetical protein C8R43DRAFT_298081 [Mycena crocata]
MRQSLVLYDDRGPAKSLPKRGSLYASRPETVGANVLRWALMNVLIFLLPFVTNLLVLLAAQSHLRTHGIVCVTYAYFYFSFTSVCALLAIATGLFPRFFRYHLTLTLLLERRRHRSHFSFMSQRRINALCGTGGFTVFIIGLASCSLPLFVTDDTTVGEIYEHLVWLGLVPKRSCQQLYFALRGRRVDWSDTMQCLGLGTLSHLELRITIPGGASNAGPSQASSSRPQRNKDTSLMTELLAEEHLDEFGKPRKNRPADGSRIRKRKRKQKTVVNTDSEDGDFTGSDSGSDSDSEIEEVISNEEVADSLPSKTVNKGKARATNPAPKKRVKKSAPSAPSASAEASSSSSGAAAGPSSATPPAGPSKQSQSGAGKQKNPIYLFFEPVTSDSDGSQAEGARYFKCFLGNREIVSITKSANHNTSKLQKHLEATSKAHFRLFHVLWKRSEPPTAFEISLAKGVERMTDALTKEYQQKSDKISGNIKEMLQKQVDDAKAPWDKAHFERLVASWVAACDQPFIAVNKPEFRAMIRYAALHPPEKIIKIPKDQSVKDEILRMEKEMVEELSAIFKVRGLS